MSKTRLNYMKLAPEGIKALQQLEHYNNTGTGFEGSLRELVRLRVSQLNGCKYCTAVHTYELKKRHEPESRINAIPNWRGSDAFTQQERAALAWADRLTRMNGEEVSDEEYAAAREHFGEKEIVDLTMVIAGINAWNRFGASFLPEWREPRAAAEGAVAPKQEPAKQPESKPNENQDEQRVVDDDGGKVTEDK